MAHKGFVMHKLVRRCASQDLSSRIPEPPPSLILKAIQRLQYSSPSAEPRQDDEKVTEEIDDRAAIPSRSPTGQTSDSQGVRELMLRTWKTRKSQERMKRMQEDPLGQTTSLQEAIPPDEGHEEAGAER